MNKMAQLSKFVFTKDIQTIIDKSKGLHIPHSRADLVNAALGTPEANMFEVRYNINGTFITEANVVRCKNGVVVNFAEDYMRRRDPDCLVVADDGPTDKQTYAELYNEDFSGLREETFEWLGGQELIITPFMAGGLEYGYEAVLIAPRNAAFFACGLAGLQHFVNLNEVEGTFTPKAVIFLAPPFRHTKFNGKQIVVHNRTPDVYEMFA